MTQVPEIVVIIVHGNAHDMASEYLKDGPLFWLCFDVHPDLIGWAVLDCNFALIDLVFNMKILYLDVHGPLKAACFSIVLKQDGTHVVLIE